MRSTAARSSLTRVALALAACCAVVAPAAAADASPDAASADAGVAAGRYLAIAAGCEACHSEPGGAPYAGGAALQSPFGALYAPNITTDAETGIGRWSEADFERALRRGIGKADGKGGNKWLYPAMPYDHYTKISDADIHALWAYMRTVPAARHESRASTLPFPLNVRAVMAVWQRAFLDVGRFEPTAGKSAEWNRGAYLVDALGHCGACHTPRQVTQASDEKRHLTGARVDGWYAPDISGGPQSTLARMDVDALVAFLRGGTSTGGGSGAGTGAGTGTGANKGGAGGRVDAVKVAGGGSSANAPQPPERNTKLFGPMTLVVHETLSRLTDGDVHAMAVYLKDQPPPKRTPAVAPAKLTTADLRIGAQVYADNCQSCHGREGRGARGEVPALAGNTAVTAREPDNVVNAVLHGFEPDGTWGAMAAFSGSLNDAQVASVTNYVRHAWGNRGERNASATQVSRQRSATEAADSPVGGDRAALSCPILPPAQLEPALAPGAAALQRAAHDPARMQRLVHGYEVARPQATRGEVVQALGTAYCRVVAAGGASARVTGAAMAEFSQQVAQAVVSGSGGGAVPRR